MLNDEQARSENLADEFADRIRGMDLAKLQKLSALCGVSERQLKRIKQSEGQANMHGPTVEKLVRGFAKLEPGAAVGSAATGGPSRPMFEDAEISSVIFEHVSRGKDASWIEEELRDRYGINWSRSAMNRAVWEAIKARRLQYVPPIDEDLTRTLHTKYSWLKDVRVVHTATASDVARVGAEMLCSILSGLDAEDRRADVAFCGGRTPGLLGHRLADFLTSPTSRRADLDVRFLDKLDKIVFHSTIGNLSGRNPWIDPNSFFLPFADSPIETEFHYLPVPGVVTKDQKGLLEEFELFRTARDNTRNLQVLISSAGHFECQQSAQYFIREGVQGSPELQQKWDETCDRLRDEGCIGDLMFNWVNRDGVIDVETPVQVVTSMGLDEVKQLAKEGQLNVLLMIGPCAECRKSKSDLLRVALEMGCVSSLVCDSRSASRLLLGRSD